MSKSKYQTPSEVKAQQIQSQSQLTRAGKPEYRIDRVPQDLCEYDLGFHDGRIVHFWSLTSSNLGKVDLTFPKRTPSQKKSRQERRLAWLVRREKIREIRRVAMPFPGYDDSVNFFDVFNNFEPLVDSDYCSDGESEDSEPEEVLDCWRPVEVVDLGPEEDLDYQSADVAPQPECRGNLINSEITHKLSNMNFKDNRNGDHSDLLSSKPFSGNLSELLSIPSRLQVIDWTETAASGTRLIDIPVRPDMMYSAETNLSYYSKCFSLWRGSLEFTFEFVCTEYHQGQLFVAFQPTDDAGSVLAYDNAVNLPSTMLELSVGKTVHKVIVPWISNTDYKICKTTSGTVTNNTTGILHVYIQNPLRSQSDIISSDIQVNVYIAAGKDFEFCNLREPQVAGYRKGARFFTAPEITFQSADGLTSGNSAGERSTLEEPISTPLDENTTPVVKPVVRAPAPTASTEVLIDRWFRAGDFDVDSTDVALATLYDVAIPAAFNTIDTINLYQLLRVNYFEKCDFEVEIRIPTTRFHQGIILMYFVPEGYGYLDAYSHATLQNFPSVKINLNQQTSGRLVIPYASIRNLWQRSSEGVQHIGGYLRVSAWNQLKVSASGGATELHATLWVRPIGASISVQVPVGDPMVLWQSAEDPMPTTSSERGYISSSQMELYDILQNRPSLVKDFELDPAASNGLAGPTKSGFLHEYLIAPFAYCSGGHCITCIDSADKTTHSRNLISVVNPGDKMWANNMYATPDAQEWAKLPTQALRFPDKDLLWFPQEDNVVKVDCPQYTPFKLYRNIYDAHDVTLQRDTEESFPSFVHLGAPKVTTTTRKHIVSIYHTAKPDFKVYMFGAVRLTTPLPIIPKSIIYSGNDYKAHTVSVDLTTYSATGLSQEFSVSNAGTLKVGGDFSLSSLPDLQKKYNEAGFVGRITFQSADRVAIVEMEDVPDSLSSNQYNDDRHKSCVNESKIVLSYLSLLRERTRSGHVPLGIYTCECQSLTDHVDDLVKLAKTRHYLNPDLVVKGYVSEIDRLATFSGFPASCPISPTKFAHLGFISLGYWDMVQCTFCGMRLMCWDKGDNILREHARWQPRCVLVDDLPQFDQIEFQTADGCTPSSESVADSSSGGGVSSDSSSQEEDSDDPPPLDENLEKVSRRHTDSKSHTVLYVREVIFQDGDLNLVGILGSVWEALKAFGVKIQDIIMKGYDWLLGKITGIVRSILWNSFKQDMIRKKDWLLDNLFAFVSGSLLLGVAVYCLKHMRSWFRSVLGLVTSALGLENAVILDSLENTGEIEFQTGSVFQNLFGIGSMIVTQLLAKLFGVKLQFADLIRASVCRIAGKNAEQMFEAGLENGVYGFFGPSDKVRVEFARGVKDRNVMDIVKKFFHLNSLKKFELRKIDSLLSKSEQLEDFHVDCTPREFLAQVEWVREYLNRYYDQMTHHKEEKSLTSFWTLSGNILKDVRNMSDVSAERKEPVGVWIAGRPGAGKSFLTSNVLPKTLLSDLGITSWDKANQQVYSLPMDSEQKYMDGYHGQIYTYVDDMAQARDGSDMNRFLQFISTGACPVNMASLDDKGQLFTSSFVVGSSNYNQVTSHVLKSPGPFYRRFPIAYRMKLKMEFETDGKLDMKALNEAFAGNMPGSRKNVFDKVWTFEKINLETGHIVPGHDKTFSQLVVEIENEYTRRRDQGTLVNTLMEGMGDEPQIQAQSLWSLTIGRLIGSRNPNKVNEQIMAEVRASIDLYDQGTLGPGEERRLYIHGECMRKVCSLVHKLPQNTTHVTADELRAELGTDPERWFRGNFIPDMDPRHLAIAVAIRHNGIIQEQQGQYWPQEKRVNWTFRQYGVTNAIRFLDEGTKLETVGFLGIRDYYRINIGNDWVRWLLTFITLAVCLKLVIWIFGFGGGVAAVGYSATKFTRAPKAKPIDIKFQGNDYDTRIRRNLSRIYNDNGEVVNHALWYDSYHLITNAHLLQGRADRNVFEFEVSVPLLRRKMHIPFKGAFVPIEFAGYKTDLVLVRAPEAAQNVRTLAGVIPNLTDLEELLKGDLTVNHLLPSGDRTLDLKGCVTINGCRMVAGVNASRATFKGDCGTPYLFEYAASQKFLFGLHTAVSKTGGEPAWYASPFSAESIAQALSRFERERIHVEPIVFQTGDGIMFSGFEDAKTIRDLGPLKLRGQKVEVFQATGTKKTKSLIHSQDYWPDDFHPAPISSQILKDRFRAVFDVEDAKSLPQEVYDWCVQEYTDSLCNIEYTPPRRPLTEEEILNVNQTFPSLGPFDINTSAGYWNLVSCKKKGLIDVELTDSGNHFTLSETDDHPYLGKSFKEHIQDCIAKCEDGEQFLSLWTTTLKDELRSTEKCRIKKTRQFQAGGFDHSYLCKKYYGAFADFYRSHPGFELMHGIGNDKESCWRHYYEGFREVNDVGWDIDGVNYGAGIRGQPSQFFQDVVDNWYAKDTKSDCLKDRTARATVISVVRHSYHITLNHVMQVAQGNKDGFFLTDVYNSITNIFYNMGAGVMIYRHKNGCLPPQGWWRNEVRCLTYGDDVKNAATPLTSEIVNRVSSAQIMEQMGLKVTSASKGSDLTPLDADKDLTFLKSSFVEHDGVILAPMPEIVIYKQLNWHAKTASDSPIIRRDIIHNALRDAAHRGEEFYNRIVEEVKERAEKLDPSVFAILQIPAWKVHIERIRESQALYNPSQPLNNPIEYETKGDGESDTRESVEMTKDEGKRNIPSFDEMSDALLDRLPKLMKNYAILHLAWIPAVLFNGLFYEKIFASGFRKYFNHFSSQMLMKSSVTIAAPFAEEWVARTPRQKYIFALMELFMYLGMGVPLRERVGAFVMHIVNGLILRLLGDTWKCYFIRSVIHMTFNGIVVQEDNSEFIQKLVEGGFVNAASYLREISEGTITVLPTKL